jgi:hypothetical protein
MSARQSSLWVAVVVLVVCGTALCDIATPRPRWTSVRMKSEEVNITVGQDRVSVEATFQMQNAGEQSLVRMGYPRGVFEKQLNEFAVFVGDQPVKDVRTEAAPAGPNRGMMDMAPSGKPGAAGPAAEPYRFEGPYKEWRVFDVPLNANETKAVRVTYWVEPAKLADKQAGSLLHYSYTMLTGATWKGKIDQAVVRVKLDGVSPDRIVRATPAGYSKTDGGKLLTWTLKDFKPADDIEITYRAAGAATVRAASKPTQ